jgi:lysophospholipase L1-like esterase
MSRGRWFALLGALLAAALPAGAQTISGHAFEDRNGNGIQDPGEPVLSGVPFEVYGTRDAGGAYDLTSSSGADGAFSFSPGSGCYLLLPGDPAGWRLTGARDDSFVKTTPGYAQPVGQPRFAKMNQGIPNLKAGRIRFTAMGDSIAYNWNSCFDTSSFWYSKQIQSRLQCVAPAASVTLDQAAVKGQHTDDLLVDDTADLNNVFRVIEIQPQYVTISMIGNDLLGVDPAGTPTQAQVNTALAEVLDSRQNLQEILSTLTSEIQGADVALNTLYDNLAYNCYTGSPSAFHRQWLPIVDRILRDLAWGQTRRASINEIAADFAHEDQAGTCFGFDGLICRDIFQTDNIHPKATGYQIVREKLWEADGGFNLGSKDALGRTSIANDFGFLRRIRRLLPTAWATSNGASVASPTAAFDDQDGGAPAQIGLGIGSEEFRLSGFPSWYDEDQIVRVIAGVRYRTTGTVTDDFYRMEASTTGQFRPAPGHAYTPTDWNYYTPIVGGGGPNQPQENPDYPTEKLLARPNVATYREVSATLTKNPVLPQGASDYQWPPVSQADLSTAAIRVVSAPVALTAANDNYQVELDAAWLDVYGWQKTRPAEVASLRISRLADGTLEISFDPLPGAERYNAYVGRMSTLLAGAYDHGTLAPAGPFCAATTADAGGGRLQISVTPAQQPSADLYFLVTAHVDDVESPAGTRGDVTEIDRSQSICM